MSPSPHISPVPCYFAMVCALVIAQPTIAQPVRLPSITSDSEVDGQLPSSSLESVVAELGDRIGALEEENVELRRSIDDAS